MSRSPDPCSFASSRPSPADNRRSRGTPRDRRGGLRSLRVHFAAVEGSPVQQPPGTVGIRPFGVDLHGPGCRSACGRETAVQRTSDCAGENDTRSPLHEAASGLMPPAPTCLLGARPVCRNDGPGTCTPRFPACGRHGAQQSFRVSEPGSAQVASDSIEAAMAAPARCAASMSRTSPSGWASSHGPASSREAK